MPRRAWSAKRERRCEYIKEGIEGRSKMNEAQPARVVGR